MLASFTKKGLPLTLPFLHKHFENVTESNDIPHLFAYLVAFFGGNLFSQTGSKWFLLSYSVDTLLLALSSTCIFLADIVFPL